MRECREKLGSTGWSRGWFLFSGDKRQAESDSPPGFCRTGENFLFSGGKPSTSAAPSFPARNACLKAVPCIHRRQAGATSARAAGARLSPFPARSADPSVPLPPRLPFPAPHRGLPPPRSDGSIPTQELKVKIFFREVFLCMEAVTPEGGGGPGGRGPGSPRGFGGAGRIRRQSYPPARVAEKKLLPKTHPAERTFAKEQITWSLRREQSPLRSDSDCHRQSECSEPMRKRVCFADFKVFCACAGSLVGTGCKKPCHPKG